MSLMQFVTWIIVVATFVVDVIWLSRNKRKWYYSISIMVLAVHAFVFYLVLFIDSRGIIDIHAALNDTSFFSDWSSVLRLHSFITIFSLEVARVPAPVILNKIKYILIRGARN